MMWIEYTPRDGQLFMPRPSKQQQNNFKMFSTLPIASGKSFKNPNFVNNLNQQIIPKSFDNCFPRNDQSYRSIIECIKETCPKVIPSTKDCNKMIFEDESVSSKITNTLATHTEKEQLGKNIQESNKSEVKDLHVDISRGINNITIHLEKLNTENSIVPTEKFIQTPNTKSMDIHLEKLNTENSIAPTEKFIQTPNTKSMDILLTKKPLAFECSPQNSITDSESSFVIFESDENEADDDISMEEDIFSCKRNTSICESEDSFIMFVDNDTENDDSNIDDDSEDEINDDEDSSTESDYDEVDSSFSIIQPKKVKFAPDEKLCEIHPMVKWSYAYQAARKGPWETYARDRTRFKDRSERVEDQIKHVFSPQHRNNIFNQRFDS